MKKQFSLTRLFLLVTMVAVIVTSVVWRSENDGLKNEILAQRAARDKADGIAAKLADDLSDQSVGTSLLCHLARNSNQHAELFNFLDTIPPGSMSCSIEDYSNLPALRVFVFHHYTTRGDGSWSLKSAHVLTQRDSIDVIDYVIDDGLKGMVSISSGPYDPDELLGDDVTEKYVITPAGFTRSR